MQHSAGARRTTTVLTITNKRPWKMRRGRWRNLRGMVIDSKTCSMYLRSRVASVRFVTRNKTRIDKKTYAGDLSPGVRAQVFDRTGADNATFRYRHDDDCRYIATWRPVWIFTTRGDLKIFFSPEGRYYNGPPTVNKSNRNNLIVPIGLMSIESVDMYYYA